MILSQEEISALEDCVNTRHDEGFDTKLAERILEKLATIDKDKFLSITKEAVRSQCDGTYREGFESIRLPELFGLEAEKFAEAVCAEILRLAEEH